MVALEALRQSVGVEATPTARPRKTGAKPVWAPLTIDQVAAGTVLAFDQSLRGCGWVVLQRGADSCEVLGCGTVRTRPSDLKGWDGTFADAVTVALALRPLVSAWSARDLGATVAHEAPPAGGGRFYRPESSTLASLGVRLAAHDAGLPVRMIPAMRAKAVVTGDRAADKRVVHARLTELAWLVGRHSPHNEHERDALAIGLTCLYRGDR